MIDLKKILKFFIILVLFFIFLPTIRADELDDINKQLDDLRRQLELSKQATEPLQQQLTKIQSDLDRIKNEVFAITAELNQKELDIKEAEKKLLNQEKQLQERVYQLYKNLNKTDPLVFIFSSNNFTQLTRLFFYQNKLIEKDKAEIIKFYYLIKRIEEDKHNLATQRDRLTAINKRLDEQSKFLAEEINKAKAFQSDLIKKIAELSKRQKELLAARSGSFFTASIGEVPLSDDPASSPNYNPGFSPAFAAFSFGAYTHRKGMSQYGAKGRAESGQNYVDIIKAYYGKEPKEVDTGGTINVSGFGELDFENYYLLGIAEMPSSFPFEALKAQAIAARTYAYRYKISGSSICTTQSCQVFSKSKADNPPELWKKAVEETRGLIIEGVVGYYSSTTGGYLTTSGWDTECRSQNCWPDSAYEKKAGSPWFYKAWYRESYSNSSASCGRNHPWLTEEEMTDILNAWVVRNKGSEEDVARILPITIKNCPIDNISSQDNPLSVDEMRNKANQLGGSYSKINSVSITFNSQGYTGNITFQTNRGSVTISGEEFKTIFNLRAPGYISIRNSLYNIEKK
ncbi:MAG: hypothetical protein KatS3mg090_0561 [Patescibacteria group bacterium]|nr:MAG: hypothetical protein KatS3mg090_0561 [Patescibacteria group bacterium]